MEKARAGNGHLVTAMVAGWLAASYKQERLAGILIGARMVARALSLRQADTGASIRVLGSETRPRANAHFFRTGD